MFLFHQSNISSSEYQKSYCHPWKKWRSLSFFSSFFSTLIEHLMCVCKEKGWNYLFFRFPWGLRCTQMQITHPLALFNTPYILVIAFREEGMFALWFWFEKDGFPIAENWSLHFSSAASGALCFFLSHLHILLGELQLPFVSETLKDDYIFCCLAFSQGREEKNRRSIFGLLY